MAVPPPGVLGLVLISCSQKLAAKHGHFYYSDHATFLNLTMLLSNVLSQVFIVKWLLQIIFSIETFWSKFINHWHWKSHSNHWSPSQKKNEEILFYKLQFNYFSLITTVSCSESTLPGPKIEGDMGGPEHRKIKLTNTAWPNHTRSHSTANKFISPNTAAWKTQTSHTVRFEITTTPQIEILFTASKKHQHRKSLCPLQNSTNVWNNFRKYEPPIYFYIA